MEYDSLVGEGNTNPHATCCDALDSIVDLNANEFLEIIRFHMTDGTCFGFRFYEGQRRMIFENYLDATHSEKIIIIHILLGNGVSLENWKRVCTKAIIEAKDIVVIVEHRKECEDWPEDDVDFDNLIPMGEMDDFIFSLDSRFIKIGAANLKGDINDVRNILYILDKRNIPISVNYEGIELNDIDKVLLDGWKSSLIPLRQRALTKQQLEEMYAGNVNVLFRILEDCVKESFTEDSTILELGCSTGYYYEILNHLLETEIKYTGVDFSSGMIGLARKYYPKAKFVLADGLCLPFEDREFSIVISGSILLHNLEYGQHIKETCRVANNRIIIHRTPICRKRKTLFQKKQAYGVDVLEVRFNEIELLNLFEINGFELVKTIEYVTETDKDEFEVTHLLRRK